MRTGLRLVVLALVAAVVGTGAVVVSPTAAFAAGSGQITSADLTRDISNYNQLHFDVQFAGAGFANVVNGPCGDTSAYTWQGCYVELWAQPYGSTSFTRRLQASGLQSNHDPSFHFIGDTDISKVVALEVVVSAGNIYIADYTSPAYAVSDSYPSHRSVQITASAGHIKVNASGFVESDGACGQNVFGVHGCWIEFYAKENGSWVRLDQAVGGGPEPNHDFDFDFAQATGASPTVTAVKFILTSNNGNIPDYTTPSYPLRDLTNAETLGGGNPSQRGCQCAGADPVNLLTGEFYEPAVDVTLPGAGPSVSISRTYSSLAATQDGPFGFGWATNFSTRLEFASDADSDGLPDVANVVQDNGAVTPFDEAPDGTYPADPWVTATLTHSAASGHWTFTQRNSQASVFDASGALLSETDVHGSTITFHYTSGLLTSITGSGGRELDLSWDSGGTHVVAISDSASRTLAYHYKSAGDLTSVTGVDGSTTSYGYDSSHLMLTTTRPDGGVLTNTFGTSDRIVSQTDQVGRTTTFAYDGSTTTQTNPDGSATVTTYIEGAIASITTDAGTAAAETTSYGYDENLNRSSVTDPLGNITTSTFDDDGNALTSTDPLGNVTAQTFNSLHEPLTVEDALGRTTTNTYDTAGDLLTSTTPAGHVTTLTYNTDGTVATSTDPRGKESAFTYDSAGLPLCVTDPDSRQTCQSYDSRGFSVTKTDAASKITHFTYDDAGRVLTVEDPNSHTTTYTYDGDGNLTSTVDASGHTVTATYDDADQRSSSTDGRGKTTTYTYTSRGSLATVTDPNSHVTTNAYDGQNQLTSVTDPDGHVTSFTYDLAGHKLSTTMPSTAVTSSTYDDDGRVATTTDALGKVTTYAYDDAGQLHSVTDPLSRVTTYSYTDDGKLHVTTLPDSSTETYTYNADDVQTSFENADGQTTTYSYDDAGLLTSETQPGSMTTGYSYDAAGRVHTITTPDGVVATRSYDDAGRLTGINYPGTADDVSYTYFADGARHTMIDETGTTTYAYNANSALTSVQNGDGQTIGYGYDNASQLTSVTYPGSKTVAYGYDNAGNMTSVTDWASRTTTLTVTADGLQNTRTDPSGVTETRSYNANDQLTDINTATSTATLSDYGYGYDNAGQLTSSTLTDPIHTTPTTNTWGYTNLGQLSSTGPSVGYTTTPAGELTATPEGDAFSFNSKQELASATNTSSGTSTAYSYNDNGSRTATVTSASGTTTTVGYDYDARGNLTSVTTGATTVTYQSDGDGLRQSRSVGTAASQFLWDPNHAIPVLLDDGTDSYIYATSVTPIAQVNDGTGAIEYLNADNVGSVRTITSATGTVVGSSDYSPYGAVTTHTGTSTSAFGYAAAWADPATGLDYLRAREYEPNTAQFLQVDPVNDQTRQPYEYVAGDPLDGSDPSGRTCQTNFQDYIYPTPCQRQQSQAKEAQHDASLICAQAHETALEDQMWANAYANAAPWQRALMPSLRSYGEAYDAVFGPFDTIASTSIGASEVGELLSVDGAAESVDGATLSFSTEADARGALSGDGGVAANRFFRGATSKSQDFQATALGGGAYRLQFFTPANNSGYGKLYVQQIDGTGTVISEYKDTMGPNGLIERKWVHGGP